MKRIIQKMSGCKSSPLLLAALLQILLAQPTAHGFTLPTITGCVNEHTFERARASPSLVVVEAKGGADEEDDLGDEWIAAEISEVIVNDADKDDEEEWITDRERAVRRRNQAEKAHAFQEASARYTQKTSKKDTAGTAASAKVLEEPFDRPSPYTEEEEEVICFMGGKANNPSKRQPGYLGDSTLAEIATDYSVPVCYLADVLCMWGVPVPIDVNDRLGDLVTGEQAFAILEAVNSLDVSALHDRYSNQSLLNVCSDWDINLSEGFELAMKEGWSLPFGVQTVLRVEQEEELLRVLGGHGMSA